MPKLYEYFGLIVFFYSNEHEPIHVHGKYQNTEGKAEFIIDNGKIVEIRYSNVKGRRPLEPNQLRDFQVVVEYFAEEIVQKWIEYFIWHKSIPAQTLDAQNSVTLAEDEIVDIEEVSYVEAYKLLLQFSNGVQRLVDFGPFLMASTNPMIRKYLDLGNFKQVALADGNIQWNEYDLCFPIADLYAGSL